MNYAVIFSGGVGSRMRSKVGPKQYMEVEGKPILIYTLERFSTNEVIDKYGLDAFRYYFLRHIDTFADSDFTWEKFDNAYNNELANDLGNLVQRLATLAKKAGIELRIASEISITSGYMELMNKYEFSKAFDLVWEKVQGLNKRIDEEKPWTLIKNGEEAKVKKCLTDLICDMLVVNLELSPFLPDSSKKIADVFDKEIEPPKVPLFPKE